MQEKMKKITISLTDDLHFELKMICLKKRTSINDFVLSATQQKMEDDKKAEEFQNTLKKK